VPAKSRAVGMETRGDLVIMANIYKTLGGKKATVWLVACIFVIFKVIDPETWFKVTMIFIAAHGVQDGLYTYLEGKNHEKDN
jgi:hypothetical protein